MNPDLSLIGMPMPDRDSDGVLDKDDKRLTIPDQLKITDVLIQIVTVTEYLTKMTSALMSLDHLLTLMSIQNYRDN